ncbi:3-dehydroquinate synthase II [Glycomyces sp. TRM65418]|uniref:3-dehydroquinate synthase II n=1 Tax=Glycomyces sp. TRM65418 TaxID=2867006 RepID=UPI00272C96F2|nr:3-dehydroquinate synthase II [Glycomyces sp. TRM65418]
MKLCWIDIRSAGGAKKAIIEEAVHQRANAIASANPADLKDLPPTVTKVLLALDKELPADLADVDVLILPHGRGDAAKLAKKYPKLEFGSYVEIVDAESLDRACEAARSRQWSVLDFADPTKIPLEIVLAAAAGAEGSIITTVADVEEAEIVFGVLEHGSDGVMLAPRTVGEATALVSAAAFEPGELELTELTVTATAHIGMGDRACVDTCTHFRKDEGILVGSHSKGMVLCVSETHPLPYMPTRPFRVNAGAIHSYTLSQGGRTNYLSELTSGSKVMAVDVKGQTRMVSVGRVKIESRPLISIDAVAPSGQEVNLIMQDDWHVRVLGPGGAVLNSTELKPGDKLLGYLPTEDRHVGYPINEFCLEK